MNVAPGAWRYALPPLLVAPFALFISVFAGIVSVAAGVAVLAFFRDPDRSPPPTGVVSPADGKVSVLREEGDRVRLGVFMNVWDVHVIRAPFAGAVDDVEHTPGANKPAFSKESDRNERVHVRFAPESFADAAVDEGTGAEPASGAESPQPEADGGDRQVSQAEREADGHTASDVGPEVTLIAGAFARRITPYVDAGDEVDRCERIGHIAFGSRVDVLFPPAVDLDDIVVEPGERVTSGETVLLEVSEQALLAEGMNNA